MLRISHGCTSATQAIRNIREITKLGTTDEAKLHLSVVLTGQGRKRSTDHRLEEQKEYFKSR